MYICVLNVFLVTAEVKRGHWIPRLELLIVVSLHVGAGN